MNKVGTGDWRENKKQLDKVEQFSPSLGREQIKIGVAHFRL